jgi:ribose transport system substrate-binding protein
MDRIPNWSTLLKCVAVCSLAVLTACSGGGGGAPTAAPAAPTTAPAKPATAPSPAGSPAAASSPAASPVASPAPAASPVASPAVASASPAASPAAAASPSAAPLPTVGKAPAGKKVGLALSTLNNPFFVSLRDGAQQAADQAGVQLVVADGANDNARQADEISNFITQQVDVILVNPTDSDAVVPSVQKANDAKIPVIALDRSSNGGTLASFIASNNIVAGRNAAQLLNEAVPQGAKVAMLIGVPGASAARDRGQGFTDALADKSINTKGVTLVAQQVANFDRGQALNVMQNVLTANPDIAGVFCQNDEMALGAVQAISARNLTGKVAVVGVDGTPDAITAIKNGEMYGTVAQQPDIMGQLGIAGAVEILNGATPPQQIDVPLKTVTKANAS